MRDILRKLVHFISGLVLIAVIASSTLIVMFCNTTTLKPLITDQVAALTGRNAVIDGKIHWTFFPNLAVNVSHIRFVNSRYAKQAYSTEISNMNIGLRLLPILYGKMEAADINATIDTHSLSSDMSVHILLNSQLRINLHRKLYTFSNLTLLLQSKNKSKLIDINMAGNVIADFEAQTLNWNDFTCQSALGSFVGNVSAKDILGTPAVSGHINATIPDVNTLLQSSNQKVNVIQEAKRANGDLVFQYRRGMFDVHGNIQVADVLLNNLKMSDLEISFDYKNHSINMTSITSNMYGGKLSGKGNINLVFDYPQIAFEGNLTSIDSAILWNEMVADNHKINVTGQGNISFNMNTVGSDTNKLLKNLSGKTVIEITDGYLLGKDLSFWINHAYKPLNKKLVFDDKVAFSKLTGSMTIKNGLVLNNDLVLVMPELIAQGKGQIDLQERSVEYVLQASVKKVIVKKIGNVELSNKGSVPIHIEGSLEDPKIYVKNNSV